ncbi:MAG: FUSC family protein [Peptostreptococcaceae bacterium]
MITDSFIKSTIVLLLLMLFKGLFGKENTLIGMIMGLAVVSLLNRDFTLRIRHRTITFILLNLILGISAYAANINVWFGFIINLLTITVTTYIYMNDFRDPTSFIFLMLYIFMWSIPVSIQALPKRLIALVIGVFIIILIQIIYNKNKLKNTSKKLIIDIIKKLRLEIDNVINSINNIDENIKINNEIRNLFKLVDDSGSNNYNFTLLENIIFNIAVGLDRMNFVIEKIKEEDTEIIDVEFLNDLSKQLKNIEEQLNNSKENTIDNELKYFSLKYSDSIKYKSYVYELIEILHLITINTKDLSIKGEEELKKIDYESNKIFKFNFKKNQFNIDYKSLRFVYSIRLGLAISIPMFIVQYYNIPYGRWIVITIYVLMKQYQEDTISKVKGRFKGTLLGIILFLVIFSLIKYSLIKIIVLFIAFFFYFYFKEYYKKVIFMTIISLSSAALVIPVNVLSINRFMFIIIGILIAMIFNKFVFPYRIEDSIDELKEKYQMVTSQIIKEISTSKKEDINLKKLIKLALVCNQIENKLLANNIVIQDKNVEVFIYRQSILMSSLRFLILEIRNKIEENYIYSKEVNEINIEILKNNIISK